MNSKPESLSVDNVKYVREDLVKKETIKPIFEDKNFQPFEIGAVYLIRTVTMIDVGRVVSANDKWIVLEDAAWIADTGRFSDALKKCSFNEVEPFPDGLVIIGAGSIIDAVQVSDTQRSKK